MATRAPAENQTAVTLADALFHPDAGSMGVVRSLLFLRLPQGAVILIAGAGTAYICRNRAIEASQICRQSSPSDAETERPEVRGGRTERGRRDQVAGSA